MRSSQPRHQPLPRLRRTSFLTLLTLGTGSVLQLSFIFVSTYCDPTSSKNFHGNMVSTTFSCLTRSRSREQHERGFVRFPVDRDCDSPGLYFSWQRWRRTLGNGQRKISQRKRKRLNSPSSTLSTAYSSHRAMGSY